MLEISFIQFFIFIIICWLICRFFVWFLIGKKNPELISAKIIIKREVFLLLFFLCILVISRIVYFPWHHVDGHIGKLKFDASKILPLRVNLIPFVRLGDFYDGWQMNIIGNITMFIPVGIIWPLSFKKLDRLWKSLLAGAGFSLIIEISQLAFFERSTDIDDLILNTSGVFIGSLIYFGIKKLNQIFRK
ncbi:MAG: VanZ family protein [Treponema sp.]|nr:VanZ family protein [Treponema sp.]